MLCFVKRSSGHAHEPSVILITPPSSPFCDVGTDAIRSPQHLLPDSVSGKKMPLTSQFPQTVSQLFCKLVYLKVLEVASTHGNPL